MLISPWLPAVPALLPRLRRGGRHLGFLRRLADARQHVASVAFQKRALIGASAVEEERGEAMALWAEIRRTGDVSQETPEPVSESTPSPRLP
jgi:hypothetical protein